jgi:hydroxyethylthiazole kinase-like uncharacterized protein yjeF
MTELLTAAQMRAIEAAAIASGEVTGLELMERAGRGVVEAIFEEWPELGRGGGSAPVPPGYLQTENATGTARKAVVLCGPGNNGGDGFVVARLLKERGWVVDVVLYGDPEKLPPDARVNYERWLGMGEVRPLQEYLDSRLGWKCDVLVDALFGTGLTRPLPEFGHFFWNMDDMVRDSDIEFGHLRGRPAIVAVDVPSGLCADSGRLFPHDGTHNPFGAFANLTVTFQTLKVGHLAASGPEQSGKVVVKDIGLAGQVRASTAHARSCKLVEAPRTFRIGKKWGSHKYSHGHALILSGPSGRGGAARLAARGALRIGAGLVTVGAPEGALAEHAARLDAVMLREVGTAEGLKVALGDGRINALCVGPGLGVDARGREIVAAALCVDRAHPPAQSLPHEGGGRHEGPEGRSDDGPVPPAAPSPLVGEGLGGGAPGAGKRAVVLDADALTILSREPDLFAALHDRCLLTPHAGEFSRLFPDIAAKLAAPATKGPVYSKVDATREAAARAGCVVLFKGPDTVIADPSGRCSINSAHYNRAAPWLATAGSGDVLAGFITGLLARGLDPMGAAEAAAWLHVECALSFGPGLIAEDLPEELPKVFRALGL